MDDPFTGKLLWTHSWHHYSPVYQWRGSTQRAPCRNREAEEEASAFPLPCRDEPPTGNIKSSAKVIMSSKTPQKLLYSPHQGQFASQPVTETFLQTHYFPALQQQVWAWKLFAFVCSQRWSPVTRSENWQIIQLDSSLNFRLSAELNMCIKVVSN